MVGSLKMNTALEYSTRVVQEGDRRCEKSTLNDLAYLTPLRIPLMNPVLQYVMYNMLLIIPDERGKILQFLKLFSSSPMLEFLDNLWGLGTE